MPGGSISYQRVRIELRVQFWIGSVPVDIRFQAWSISGLGVPRYMLP
jgi:hypothetical protein